MHFALMTHADNQTVEDGYNALPDVWGITYQGSSMLIDYKNRKLIALWGTKEEVMGLVGVRQGEWVCLASGETNNEDVDLFSYCFGWVKHALSV